MEKIASKFNLQGKVAVVTGASKGIGKSIARNLAEHGARVVVSSRKEDAVRAVAEEFRSLGLEAVGIGCHVGDAEQRERLIEKTVEIYGRLDILVNNAAINPYYGPLEGSDDAAFDKTMDVNVKAPMMLSNLAFPHMKHAGGGSIINIASVEGVRPGYGLGVYSVSKAALIMLTRNQAKEWGRYGVRANSLCPGLIKTKFSEGLWSNEKVVSGYTKLTPLGRIADPDEMAGIVVLLASEAGSYITGGEFAVDGGYLISG